MRRGKSLLIQTIFFILYTTTETSRDFALLDRSGLVDKTCWNSYFGPFAGRALIAPQYVGSQVKKTVIGLPRLAHRGIKKGREQEEIVDDLSAFPKVVEYHIELTIITVRKLFIPKMV